MRKSKSATLISKQYRRKGFLIEVWLRLRTNRGAVFGLAVLALFILIMVYTFIFMTPADVSKIDSKSRYLPPSAAHPFGTDDMGRDLFVRVLYGTRYSLAIAFGAVGIGAVIGTFFGSIAGYYGGWTDQIIMRITDVLHSLPGILLGMVIVTILGAGLQTLMIAIGFTVISGFVRMARASVLSVKTSEFVESARAIGMSEFRIVFSQVLPNSISPLIVTFTARMATSVLAAAGLSFLGFGVPVPLPEWGALISAGRNYLTTAPHLTLFPGIFIMLMAFSCALLGDGLRDALDPKLNK